MRTGFRTADTRGIIACTAALAILGAFAPNASATGVPSIGTGAAHAVSYGSATLTGSVDPRGGDTTYYFQYGPTKAYGGQTALANAGAGSSAVPVDVPVGGLAPLTVYHYRLVAVNAAGAGTGADRSFETAAVPLSLQILSAPNPVSFGGAILVQGTLSGSRNANREVVLQANAFPFSAGFANTNNPEVTTSTGGFTFAVLGLTVATQYRVVGVTSPPVVSPIVTESVAVQVEAHLGRARKAHHVRVYGTVTPAIEGMRVDITRLSHGHEVQVGETFLRHDNASSSRFSRVIRARRGIYRVLVQVTNGAQTSSYSSPLLIR
jgi:hypothetical protein